MARLLLQLSVVASCLVLFSATVCDHVVVSAVDAPVDRLSGQGDPRLSSWASGEEGAAAAAAAAVVWDADGLVSDTGCLPTRRPLVDSPPLVVAARSWQTSATWAALACIMVRRLTGVETELQPFPHASDSQLWVNSLRNGATHVDMEVWDVEGVGADVLVLNGASSQALATLSVEDVEPLGSGGVQVRLHAPWSSAAFSAG